MGFKAMVLDGLMEGVSVQRKINDSRTESLDSEKQHPVRMGFLGIKVEEKPSKG